MARADGATTTNTPYFETGLGKLYLGDCLDILKEMPSESIDTVWTDPPYNIDYEYNGYVDKRDDYFEWCGQWIKECHRLLKPSGSIFIKQWYANIPKMTWILEKDFKMKNIIIWKRKSQAGYKDRFLGGYEAILFYSKTDNNKFNPDAVIKKTQFTKRWDNKKKYKGRLHDIWTDIQPVTCGSLKHPEGLYVEGTGKKEHPAQHPIEIVKRCIICSTDKGDVVLDPLIGSGTTGVACEQLERQWIGIEIDEKYCKDAISRLTKWSGQIRFV